MNKFKYICVLFLLGTWGSVRSQDVHFSQVWESPLFISPANTGFFNGYFRAIANYRSQWASMGNPYQTIGLNMDGGLFKSKKRKAFLGLGFSLFSDKAGAAKINHTNALLNVSGVLKLHKRGILSVGLNGGADATSAQYTNLTWGSQFDGNTINVERSSGEEARYRQFTTMDIGAGIAYQYARVITDQDHDDVTSARISFGAFHLNRPNQEYWAGSQYRLPVRYTTNLSVVHDFEDTRFSLYPCFMVSKQYQAWEYVAGTYIKYRTRVGTKVSSLKTENSLGIGIFYRSNDAFVYKLSYELSNCAFALSYDMNTSGYRTASKMFGGFEVSLRYNVLSASLFDSRNEYK